jgi:hypothetical protein
MQVSKILSIEEKLDKFGHGPWINEADIVEFVHAGLHCKIVRSIGLGFLNGYIFLPSFYKAAKDFSIHDLETHGTILTVADGLWIHSGHGGDRLPAFDFEENNAKPYRTMEFMIERCKYLAEQIVEAYEPHT